MAPALEELPKTEEHYRLIYDNTPVMMHSINRDGHLVSVNDYWLRTLGHRRDQVLGRHVGEFLAPSSRSFFESVAIPDLLKAGGLKDVSLRMVRRNGEIIDVLLNSVLKRDEAGRVEYSLAFVVDVTERKRADAALRESEGRLASIVESAMDAIVTFGEDRTIRLFNAAAEDVFRCSADDAVGVPIDRFASEALGELLSHWMDAFSRSGAGKRYLWTPHGVSAVRANGEEFSIEATISQAHAAGEKLYTMILRDVDDRERAAQELQKLQLENVYLREETGAELAVGEVVGASGAMKRVLESVRQVAATDSTVLVTGETGTGKELIARAIHNLSGRRQRVMVKINCAAMPAGLIESELFGHEKGAFTGAVSRRIGRFELADGGTIFLDEIGDLPLELQAKLLRVLQDGEFERVGGSRLLTTDARVIAATNRDLEHAMAEKRFRPDLYYRINTFPIHIPALRQRREDIPSLLRHFTLLYSTKMGRRIDTIPQATMDALVAYPWPGNVRELQNVIERAVILSRGASLDVGDWLPQPAVTTSGSPVATLEVLERRHILDVLELTGWIVRGNNGAATLLDVKPTTLESRMKKLGISRPPLGDSE